jgi:hypothetical protein
MDTLYKDLFETNIGGQDKIDIKSRSDLRRIYFDFLCDFKKYLAEYVRESLVELAITEMPVSTNPVKLFNGEFGGLKLTLKNQGNIECYVTTQGNGLGGYRLNPGEKESFWLNKPVSVVTVSGTTCLGMIRS